MKEDSKSKERPKTNLKHIESKEERQKAFKDIREGKTKGYSKQVINQCKNLKPLNERDPEEAKAIRRKGAEAINKARGEKKNAKQILDEILPLFANRDTIRSSDSIPEDIKQEILRRNIDVTHYHLVYLALLSEAEKGNVKAIETLRDTAGDKPITETHNLNEIITESDKALIEKIGKRLNIQD